MNSTDIIPLDLRRVSTSKTTGWISVRLVPYGVRKLPARTDR